MTRDSDQSGAAGQTPQAAGPEGRERGPAGDRQTSVGMTPEVERLREALAPFAKLAEFYADCEQHPKGCPDDASVGEIVDLTVGDFRRAAAALSTDATPVTDTTDEIVREAVSAAAVEWCGEKERETFPEDIAYFEANWLALPGLKARVDKHLTALRSKASDTTQAGVEEGLREAAQALLDACRPINGHTFGHDASDEQKSLFGTAQVALREALRSTATLPDTVRELVVRASAQGIGPGDDDRFQVYLLFDDRDDALALSHALGELRLARRALNGGEG